MLKGKNFLAQPVSRQSTNPGGNLAGPPWSTRHDHRQCVDDAINAAAELCRRRGARLTDLRKRVLELIWASHQPIGAYAVLDALRAERSGAAPPTVYRALDFLLEHGLIHRIESLNAFIGCSQPNRSHGGQFLICRSCGDAVELDDGRIDQAIRVSAADAGFEVQSRVVEAVGVCPTCRKA
jgi:Fur family zinc uptake transcriptional regulator